MKLKDLIVEKKDDKIRVQGLGTYDYKSLKRNVEKKMKDLTKRNKKGNHMGVGKNQFNVFSAGEFCEENVCRPGCQSDSNRPFGQVS